MSRDFATADSDLCDVLCGATEPELALLVQVMRNARSCYMAKECRDPVAVTHELQLLGGDTLKNLFWRFGDGVPYRELLSDVAKKFDVTCPNEIPIEQIEWMVVVEALRRASGSLKRKGREAFEAKLRETASIASGKELWDSLREGHSQARARYELVRAATHDVVKEVWKDDDVLVATYLGVVTGGGVGMLVGGGVGAAVGAAIGAVIGRILDAIFNTLFTASGPAYKATVPAVFVVAMIRLRLVSEGKVALRPARATSPTHGSVEIGESPASSIIPGAGANVRSKRATSYYIQSTSSGIRAWSTFSIPYEPRRDEHRELKEELQKRLDELSAPVPVCRYGIYGAPPGVDRGDTENRLFYNVGRWETVASDYPVLQFVRLPIGAIRKCPVELTQSPEYYFEYGHRDPDVPVERGVSRSVHLAITAHMDDAGALEDPAQVWMTTARALAGSGGHAACGSVEGIPFGLRVVVSMTDRSPRRRAIKMKPVFDGVLSALHVCDMTHEALASVAARLADRLGVSQAEVCTLLSTTENKLLGPHPFALCRAGNIQFSPKDDLCVAGELRLTSHAALPGVVVNAELFTAH